MGIQIRTWKMSSTHDTKDTSPLFLSACEAGRLEDVRSLLSLGADVNWRREDSGWTGG